MRTFFLMFIIARIYFAAWLKVRALLSTNAFISIERSKSSFKSKLVALLKHDTIVIKNCHSVEAHPNTVYVFHGWYKENKRMPYSVIAERSLFIVNQKVRLDLAHGKQRE